MCIDWCCFSWISARSVSPHSPRSPHTSLTQPNSGGSGSSGAGGDAEGRRQRVAGGGEEGGGREEEAEVKRQSALLQVSEAHLAILPDEDGDTWVYIVLITHTHLPSRSSEYTKILCFFISMCKILNIMTSSSGVDNMVIAIMWTSVEMQFF